MPWTLSYLLIALSLSLATPAWPRSNLYWNSLYDPDCDACLQPGVACKQGSCITHGSYLCQNQWPPLQPQDDPRLSGLIRSGQCKFLDVPYLQRMMPSANWEKIEECRFMSGMAGARRQQNNHDPKQVMQFKEMAKVEKSIPSSAIWLAQYYDYGIGTPQDRKKATRLVRQGAKMGDPIAQYAISFRYAYGIGAPKNTALAIKWLNKMLNARLNPPSKLESPIINYFFPDYESMQVRLYDLRKQAAYCAQILLDRIKSDED